MRQGQYAVAAAYAEQLGQIAVNGRLADQSAISSLWRGQALYALARHAEAEQRRAAEIAAPIGRKFVLAEAYQADVQAALARMTWPARQELAALTWERLV